MGEMIPLIDERREEIERLCVRYGVRRLELFGSAAGGSFDPDRSDLDFLVEFQDLPLDRYADSYFGLLFALEDLFGRHVDLVMTSAIRNPYFLAEIEASRTVLYEAA
jgi:predicted nucleotidyltransferase